MGDFKRAVFQYKDPIGRTWSEAYIFANKTKALKDVAEGAVTLLEARVKLFPPGITIVNAYVSDDDEFRDSRPVDKPSPDPDGVWNKDLKKQGGDVQDTPDFAWTSLLVRCLSGNRYTKATYLGGVPDSYTVDTANATVTNPNFMKAYNKFVASLKTTWAWKGIINTKGDPDAKTITLIKDNNGQLQVTTSAAHGFVKGQTVLISKSKNEGGRVNGWRIIDTVDTNTTFTLKLETPDVYRYLSGGFVLPRKYDLFPIEDTVIVRLVNKKRGMSIGLVRGRARVRKR